MKSRQASIGNEERFIQRAIQGDKKAFGYLYEHYLDEIFRYVYYRVSDQYEAEDLTETVFIKAWDALPKFHQRKINLRAWLYRIAHNLVIDHYRTRKDVDQLPTQPIASKEPDLDHQLLEREQSEKLARAIQQLDEKYRQVILCRFINGLSHAETAAVLGIKEGHVRVLQLRALEKIRYLLEETHE